MGISAGPSGFDKLARLYRWMEYGSFGPLLQQTRLAFLGELRSSRRVLVLGDGDGRFCAALLRTVPSVHAVALDASAAMLQRLRLRAAKVGAQSRLTTVHCDALLALPPGEFDAVCSHFFLDCLGQQEVRQLVSTLRLRSPSAPWIVSEFAIPAGAARFPARVAVRSLYVAFRLLTGLRVRQLPDHAAVFRQLGYDLCAERIRLFGLLRSEVWVPGNREETSNSKGDHHAWAQPAFRSR